MDEFSRRKRSDRKTGRLYYMAYCKPCASERNRRRLYGATLAEMTEKQGSEICPLCQVRKADSLDHDHETGKPRGAICRKCNLIMHYMDDAEWRARAEAYVASD